MKKGLYDILNKIAKGREDPDVDTPVGACITLKFNYENCDWDIINCSDVESRDQCDEGLNGQHFTIYKNCTCEQILSSEPSSSRSCFIWRGEIPQGPEGEEEDGLCCLTITSNGGSTYKLCRGWTTRCGCERYSRDPALTGIGKIRATFYEDKPGLESCEDIDCTSDTGACCREEPNGKCSCVQDQDVWQCFNTVFNKKPGMWYPDQQCANIIDNCCYPIA